MTELRLWALLGTCSRRALLRRTKKFGHPYTYKPRGDLLVRLSRETGLTEVEVFYQLLREREELLRDRD